MREKIVRALDTFEEKVSRVVGRLRKKTVYAMEMLKEKI